MRKFYIWSIALFVLFLGIDLLTKVWVVSNFALHESMNVCSFFSFTYIRNQGAAWGMFQGAHILLAIFGILATIACILFRKKLFGANPWNLIPLGILCSGIIGNMLDRLLRGYVVDFLDFYWGTSHFPCFNVADIAICCGVGLLFLIQLLEPKK